MKEIDRKYKNSSLRLYVCLRTLAAMKTVWLEQRSRLQELAKSLGLLACGVQATLTAALTFGEMLTLISDEPTTVRLIQEDHEGALSFLNLVSELTEAIETADEHPSTSELNGSFHELADFAVEFINELRREAIAANLPYPQ
jgi:hypothetical protein